MESRTPDILLAKQTLYQLSYVPSKHPSILQHFCSGIVKKPGDPGFFKWVRMDSNHRPSPYQSDALTS